MKESSNSLRWICQTLLLMAFVSLVACSSPPQSGKIPPGKTPSEGTPTEQTTGHPALPGQAIWKQGVSSYVFGTNDTHEWADNNNNIETQPKFQQALRDAGFTLMRSFFPNNATDEVILQRLRTIQKSGASCLAVITNIDNTDFDEHLVSYLGNNCLLYEFGNETDLSKNDSSVEHYLDRWNTLIPALRRINPSAKFIGPVTSDEQGQGDNPNFMHDFLEGVKTSGVLPDAVSFHWYPCDNDTQETCLGRAKDAGAAAGRVAALVQAILGKPLPIGITEWNYDANTPPPAYGDNADFITKFTTDALSSMIEAGVTFACQFDAASYAGYGRLDMFDTTNNDFKPQYYAIKSVIQQYRPSTSTP